MAKKRCTPETIIRKLREADMMVDSHYISRGPFEEADVNGAPLRIPAMVPRLSQTPGRTDWPGPELGAFNREIYSGLLGLSEAEIEELEQRGIA